MKDKKNINTDEIRKQASILFALIEALIPEHSEDAIDEAIADQMGDFLKSSVGCRELVFSYEMAQTKSERAIHDLERATWDMTDDTLSDLYELATNAVEVVEIIEGNRPQEHLRHRLPELKKHAPDILQCVVSEWWTRTRDYRDEIEKLRGQS